MDKQIPISNNGQSPIFVAGKMIPPGETRLFDESELPPEHRPQADEETGEQDSTDPLLAVVALSVAKLEQGLAALTDEELARLEGLEQAKGKPRQGALAAITAERLRRAEAGATGGAGGEGAGAGSEGA